MRAGNLDRIIERETTGLDLYGTPVRVWVPVATMCAQKLENVISDREGARGNTTDDTITFRTRWLVGIGLPAMSCCQCWIPAKLIGSATSHTAKTTVNSKRDIASRS